MNLNATLLGQMITFGIFVWFTMRFVWPVLEAAMAQREAKIADGLAASEKGHQLLEDAKASKKQLVHEAREKANQILEQAHQQAEQIIEHAKAQGVAEKNRLIQSGKSQVENQFQQAQVQLRQNVVQLTTAGVEKILARTMNDADHQKLIQQTIEQLG